MIDKWLETTGSKGRVMGFEANCISALCIREIVLLTLKIALTSQNYLIEPNGS